MKHILNTLYINSEDIYLSLDGENVVANREKTEVARYPLHTLESILSFSYSGASPALMGACAKRGINLAFCSPRGRFLARAVGETSGNVLLRRKQYRIADDRSESILIARNFIFGKVYNSRWSIERTLRDHRLRVDGEKLSVYSQRLFEGLPQIRQASEADELRGIEGVMANAYFNALDHMILNNKETFRFDTRNRRPPLDPVNALLSFAYSLLSNDCSAALEAVGLDSYVGFFHTDRPGRASLALDIMEEFRPCIADRFVLTQINNRRFNANDFIISDNGAFHLAEDARKCFLKQWQEHKREELTHPYLKEKMSWGLVPYIQAQLLSRYLREDIDEYPPFLWK